MNDWKQHYLTTLCVQSKESFPLWLSPWHSKVWTRSCQNVKRFFLSMSAWHSSFWPSWFVNLLVCNQVWNPWDWAQTPPHCISADLLGIFISKNVLWKLCNILAKFWQDVLTNEDVFLSTCPYIASLLDKNQNSPLCPWGRRNVQYL